MRKLSVLVLAILCLPIVVAVPVNYFGNVTLDYEFVNQAWNVTVWANCYGTGIQPVASTTIQAAFHYYDLDIPMDEPTPPGPVGVDEGCDPTTPINITIAGNLTYYPPAGAWTVQDSMGKSDGSRPIFALGPFNLISPTNGTTIIDTTPGFDWVHNNVSNHTYRLIIYNVTNPLIKNLSSGRNTDYTLTAPDALSIDGWYYWKVHAYLDGVFNRSSSVFRFYLDTTPALIQTVLPANNSWVTNPSQTLTATTSETGTCKFASSSGVAFGAKPYTMTPAGTTHTYSLTLPSQGNNSYYIQCNDSLGNVMPLLDEWHHNIRLDNRAPSTGAASVTINGGDVYSTSSTVSVAWAGFVDQLCPANCSGITTYYYNTINNIGTATSAAASPVAVALTDGSNKNVYIWAEDLAGNVAGPLSDSITVDTKPPQFSGWVITPSNLNSSYTGSVTVSVSVTDAVTGINSYLPMLKYKRGTYDAAMTAYANMTFAGGSTYTFSIPAPTIGSWASITDQNLQYQGYAKDLLNTSNESSIQTANVSRENYEPIWVQPTAQYALEDSLLSFVISALDQDGDSLTLTANDSDLTITSLNDSSATVTWTPTNDDVGTRLVIFTATDGYVYRNTTAVAIYINNTNDAPTFATINPQSAYEHTEFYLNASATDVDVGDILTYTENSPYFVINPTTGVINFTPLVGARGQHNITVTAYDGTVYKNKNFTLTVYYCGDNVCNLVETCTICSYDCGGCGADAADLLAIVIEPRNCVNELMTVAVYQLYSRATCPTMGYIVEGYEICGNLSDVSLSVYIENPGGWEDPDDAWNLTGEYGTDDFGKIAFTPTKVGRYRFFAKKGGYPEKNEYAEIDYCYEREMVNETQQKEPDLGPLEPEPNQPEPLEPEVEEPAILTQDESSFMLFIIFYLIVPILLLSLFSAGTYYYQVNKDSSKRLLVIRIWMKKRTKLLKLYLKYWYHEFRGKLKGGSK